jgi:hypothetical protein
MQKGEEQKGEGTRGVEQQGQGTWGVEQQGQGMRGVEQQGQSMRHRMHGQDLASNQIGERDDKWTQDWCV